MKIEKLIEDNDEILKNRENDLINKINAAYEKAIKDSIAEFKKIEKIDPNKATPAQVRNILAKTLGAFSEEMENLIGPISDATKESYDEGLRETGQIVKVAIEGK